MRAPVRHRSPTPTRRRAHTRRALAATLAAALAVLSLGLATTTATAAPAARQVTPERYVRGACAAILDWIDTTGPLDNQVSITADSLGSGKTSAKAAKTKIVGLYTKAAAATGAAITTTKALGAPKVTDGAQVAADHLAVLADLRDTYTGAAKAAGKLATKDADRLYQELTTLDSDTFDAFDAIGMPLETLQDNSDLAPIIEVTSACLDVIDAYAVEFEPTGFAVGDCVSFTTWVTVPCTQAHDAEIYLATAYPAAADAAFPGDAAVHDWADQQCKAAFAGYVGSSLESSKYGYTVVFPMAETWPQGDREVLCGVSAMDDSKLTGPVQGSGS